MPIQKSLLLKANSPIEINDEEWIVTSFLDLKILDSDFREKFKTISDNFIKILKSINHFFVEVFSSILSAFFVVFSKNQEYNHHLHFRRVSGNKAFVSRPFFQAL